MLTSKHKEGVMEVRRHLVEAASKEKLPIKMGLGKKWFQAWNWWHMLFFLNAKKPQIHQKYTKKSFPVDLTSLSEAKGCSIFTREP